MNRKGRSASLVTGMLAPLTALAVLATAVAAHPFAAPPTKFDQAAHLSKPCGQEQAGYLVVPICGPQGCWQLQVIPYFPQPGDLLLYDCLNPKITLAFKMVGSGTPMHSAIVIARPEGTPAILEVGPNSTPRAFTQVAIVPVLPRLASYPGSILMRRPRQPLSGQQSADLTRFALAQEGKDFAVGRLALQITPFHCRYGLRHLLFARTTLDRDKWVCSENTVAAATIAGLMDPRVHFANAMYPRDLTYDEKYDLSATFSEPVLWVADPNPRIEGNRVYFFKKEKEAPQAR